MYWIHFQDIHTFTYQKTLLHILFLLVFKIVERLIFTRGDLTLFHISLKTCRCHRWYYRISVQFFLLPSIFPSLPPIQGCQSSFFCSLLPTQGRQLGSFIIDFTKIFTRIEFYFTLVERSSSNFSIAVIHQFKPQCSSILLTT